MSKSLNAKQARFVREYLIDGNGKQAAVRAGYSPKSAAAIAARLLQKRPIKAELEKLQQERSERLDLTADWVVWHARQKYMELEVLIQLDESELYDLNGNLKPNHEWPPIWRQKQLVHISEITTTVCKSEQNGVVQTRRVNLKRTNPVALRATQLRYLELIARHIPECSETQNVTLLVKYVKSPIQNPAAESQDVNDPETTIEGTDDDSRPR